MAFAIRPGCHAGSADAEGSFKAVGALIFSVTMVAGLSAALPTAGFLAV
ncbi:hypothetical protein [Mycolicibacterium sphagni]|nr:hypothetical protein [Mycolicibacterium sphagni]